MRGILLVAGVYNLAWGIFIYNFPDAFYSWLVEASVEASNWIVIQGAGTFVFGVLYILAALFPIRFWYLILLGLISKLAGAIGLYFFTDRNITNHFIFHVLVNDLAWIVPLALITYRAYGLRKLRTYEKAA